MSRCFRKLSLALTTSPLLRIDKFSIFLAFPLRFLFYAKPKMHMLTGGGSVPASFAGLTPMSNIQTETKPTQSLIVKNSTAVFVNFLLVMCEIQHLILFLVFVVVTIVLPTYTYRARRSSKLFWEMWENTNWSRNKQGQSNMLECVEHQNNMILKSRRISEVGII